MLNLRFRCIWRDITDDVLTIAYRQMLIEHYYWQKRVAYYRAREGD